MLRGICKFGCIQLLPIKYQLQVLFAVSLVDISFTIWYMYHPIIYLSITCVSKLYAVHGICQLKLPEEVRG